MRHLTHSDPWWTSRPPPPTPGEPADPHSECSSHFKNEARMSNRPVGLHHVKPLCTQVRSGFSLRTHRLRHTIQSVYTFREANIYLPQLSKNKQLKAYKSLKPIYIISELYHGKIQRTELYIDLYWCHQFCPFFFSRSLWLCWCTFLMLLVICTFFCTPRI